MGFIYSCKLLLTAKRNRPAAKTRIKIRPSGKKKGPWSFGHLFASSGMFIGGTLRFEVVSNSIDPAEALWLR